MMKMLPDMYTHTHTIDDLDYSMMVLKKLIRTKVSSYVLVVIYCTPELISNKNKSS